MNRNAWVLYLALGTFYNRKECRAFPTLEQLYAVFPLERYGRSRALGKLVELGLVEVWGERRQRRRRTFYRLLHVDDTGKHCAEKMQPSWAELKEMQSRTQLSEAYEWVTTAYLKHGQSISHYC